MPVFQIEKSIEINAPAEQTRQAIQNYNVWHIWSPWFCMEPSASLTVEGNAAEPGHAYSWQGDMIGAGSMELASTNGDTDHMNLTFLKPFKSKASVRFQTTAIDNTTSRVTWQMDSSLPFFMFFMVGTMKAMIGMDYERGLKLLKEYVETGAVTSSTTIDGIVDVRALHYHGLETETGMADIAESMHRAFGEVMKTAQGKTTEHYCGAIYNDMNIKTQHCRYTAFAPVAREHASGTIGGCRALKVVHTGSYHHLGNPWATAYTCQRHEKLRPHKKIKPFELYLNDPDKVAAKDLITEVYIPVAG